MKLKGTFWLYYNTNRGRPKPGRDNRPWVVRHISEEMGTRAERMYSLKLTGIEYRADHVEILAATGDTYYDPNPPWRNDRKGAIASVKGILIFSGIVEIDEKATAYTPKTVLDTGVGPRCGEISPKMKYPCTDDLGHPGIIHHHKPTRNSWKTKAKSLT